ncbi:MAG: YHS domain-containing (seleno)protein [Pseudomonadota bacterium]
MQLRRVFELGRVGTISSRFLVFLGMMSVGVVAFDSTAHANNRVEGLRETIWTDTLTGFAIGGYDPVSYYTDGQARTGEPGRETEWGGVSWAFANDGNLDAFSEAPEIYAPRFGGYDPVSLSRGVILPGNPGIWSLHEGGVFFFADAVHQAIWRKEKNRILSMATMFWRERLAANEPTMRLSDEPN